MAVDSGAIYDLMLKRGGASDGTLFRQAYVSALRLTIQDVNDFTNLGVALPTKYNASLALDEKYEAVIKYGVRFHLAEDPQWNLEAEGNMEFKYRRQLGRAQSNAWSDDPPLTGLQTADDDLLD
jgi:hypothetical protein